MNKEHRDPNIIDLEAPRLARYMRTAWKKHQNTVYWVDINLLKRMEISSIRRDRTPTSCTTHSQPIVSRRLSRWKLVKSYTRKCMRHSGLLRRFPSKTIGCRNWVQKLLDMVKTPNKPKPNQRPQIQLLEQGDLFRQNNRPVRVLRKSTNVSYLAAKAPMKEQGDLFIIVCQCLLNV